MKVEADAQAAQEGRRAQHLRSMARRVRGRVLWELTRLHRRLKASPLGWILRSPPVRAIRRRVIVGMRGRDVVEIVDAIERSGTRCWVVGGWGVDALLARQTRDHPDVDLAVESRTLAHALTALELAGFNVVQREAGMPAWMPTMLVLRDGQRRTIELFPIDVPAPPPGRDGRPEGMRVRYDADAFAVGTIAGREVHCLAARTQITVHGNYPVRERDREDVRALCDAFGLALPSGFA